LEQERLIAAPASSTRRRTRSGTRSRRRYGPVIDELDEQPRIDAETAIREARVPSRFPEASENASAPDSKDARKPGRVG